MTEITRKFKSNTKSNSPPPFAKNLIAHFNQKHHSLGSSLGICYGFVGSLILKNSPYHQLDLKTSTLNPSKKPWVKLSQEMHELQKNQFSRKESNQKIVQQQRLTREYFCPTPESHDGLEQEEEIPSYAKGSMATTLSVLGHEQKKATRTIVFQNQTFGRCTFTLLQKETDPKPCKANLNDDPAAIIFA